MTENLNPNKSYGAYLSLINYEYNTGDTLYSAINKIYEKIKEKYGVNSPQFKEAEKLYKKIMDPLKYIWNDRQSNAKKTLKKNHLITFVDGMNILICLLYILDGESSLESRRSLELAQPKRNMVSEEAVGDVLNHRNMDPETIWDVLNHKCNGNCESKCKIKEMKDAIESDSLSRNDMSLYLMFKNPKTTIQELFNKMYNNMENDLNSTKTTTKITEEEKPSILKGLKEIKDSNSSPWKKIMKIHELMN